MTLPETLLVLGMLSMLTVAAVAWTTDIVRTSEARSAQTRWEAAASQTLNVLVRDLRDGDAAMRPTSRSSDLSWLRATSDSLELPVRAAPFSGSESVAYRFNSRSGSLSRQLILATAQETDDRLLLGDLSEAAFAIVEVGETRNPRIACRVQLVADKGWTAERVIPIAAEGLP